MDWNSATLLALAIFGFVALCVMLAISLLRQLPELFEAWRKAKGSWRGAPEPPASNTSTNRDSDD
ncbi:hypothetical protein AB0E85_00975 [Streptomyces sp. NPDC029044]|uniref:hypothetical protein n=1 Tax=Streptomyces sp. NPDC029044 TaxID=3157198 RepID=UPI0033C4AFED